jgi:hypothetical protein
MLFLVVPKTAKLKKLTSLNLLIKYETWSFTIKLRNKRQTFKKKLLKTVRQKNEVRRECPV